MERLFYDGTCALCHGAVRFVLARDPEGRLFRFAPLDSAAFRSVCAEEDRLVLPDSLVLVTEDGRLLTRSEGVLHLLERLGGAWRVLARLGRVVPRHWADAAYDVVARFRHRIFGRTEGVCPIVPASIRSRFDL